MGSFISCGVRREAWCRLCTVVNLYIVIYVNGVNSWVVLSTPVPAQPDVCAEIRGCGCQCREKPPLQMGKFAE